MSRMMAQSAPLSRSAFNSCGGRGGLELPLVLVHCDTPKRLCDPRSLYLRASVNGEHLTPSINQAVDEAHCGFPRW